MGWGECLGRARPNAAVVAAYAGFLIGKDPRETEKLWATLYNALRDQGQRDLLFDLDMGVQGAAMTLGQGDATVVRLTGVYHNLLRRWTEV